MNTQTPKSSQRNVLLVILGVVMVGIPLTIFALQQQQIFQQYAWSTSQSAVSECAPQNGGAVINVSFTNTEAAKSMDVEAKDIQTGETTDLGTVKAKETKTGTIKTDATVLQKGAVLFTLTWTDGSSGTDTRTAAYKAVEECTTALPFCPANPENNLGKCSWDPLEGAQGYEVLVKEKESGDTIKSETLPETASQSAFPMVPGKAYTCTVTPVNACGKGAPQTSPEKICTAPTPTPTTPEPTPTTPACPAEPNKLGVCTWDATDGATEYKVLVKKSESGETVKTGTVKPPTTKFSFTADPVIQYTCVVTAVGKCSETPPSESPPTSCTVPTPSPTVTPTPTVTPKPSATPIPSATPTPTPSPTPTLTPTPTPTPKPTNTPAPTPTPVVIVRIPPNQVPPGQTTVQTPGQTVYQQTPGQTVIQQQPGQTVVQQQPGQTIIQQQPGVPSPTMKPTGVVSNAVILVGTSFVLLLAGAMVFFVL